MCCQHQFPGDSPLLKSDTLPQTASSWNRHPDHGGIISGLESVGNSLRVIPRSEAAPARMHGTPRRAISTDRGESAVAANHAVAPRFPVSACHAGGIRYNLREVSRSCSQFAFAPFSRLPLRYSSFCGDLRLGPCFGLWLGPLPQACDHPRRGKRGHDFVAVWSGFLFCFVFKE